MTDLFEVADAVLARAGGGEQVEVIVGRSRDTEVRAYEGEVESLSAAESQGIGVRVVSDGRQGFASAGTLDEDVLAETLDEARDNARFGEVDEFNGLAEPDGVAETDLDLFRPGLVEAPTEAKIDLALELEKAVRSGDERIVGIETAEYADSVSEAVIVTTTGIRSGGRESTCDIVCYALAEEGDETQTGLGYSVGRDLSDLDVDRAAADAVDRATRLLGASKPNGERLTVVFDPFVTAQFLTIVGSTLSGEAVLKGRSLFADRLGEPVASELVTFVDDPTDVDAFTATEADGEGLATRRNVLIDGGVLESFVHNSYTGRRSGTASTGSAVRGFSGTPGAGCQAISLAPGTMTQPELLASVGEGLLVSDVAGLHSGVNPVSGDFSTGADGLRIRGGELAEPVREVTIASTIQRMLQDVEAVGADLEWLPMSAAGVSLVVSDVTMSGA